MSLLVSGFAYFANDMAEFIWLLVVQVVTAVFEYLTERKKKHNVLNKVLQRSTHAQIKKKKNSNNRYNDRYLNCKSAHKVSVKYFASN